MTFPVVSADFDHRLLSGTPSGCDSFPRTSGGLRGLRPPATFLQPPRSAIRFRALPVVSADFDHRLLSGTPSGCDSFPRTSGGLRGLRPPATFLHPFRVRS